MTLAINPDVISAPGAGDEIRIYDAEHGEFFVLNDTGAMIWRIIEAGDLTEDGVVAEVLAAVRPAGGVVELVTHDVRAFIHDLVARNFVETA